MSKRIAGTAYVKVDGEQLSIGGSLTVSIDSAEKEGLSGLSGVAGYKETPRVPFIEVEAYIPSGFPMDKIRTLDGGTVTAELANGMTAVLSQAWLAGVVEIDAAEGKSTLKFEGIEGRWI